MYKYKQYEIYKKYDISIDFWHLILQIKRMFFQLYPLIKPAARPPKIEVYNFLLIRSFIKNFNM